MSDFAGHQERQRILLKMEFKAMKHERNLVWWEKTIEYAFILKYLSSGDSNNVVPFDGKPEQGWGDLLFQGGIDRFFLIEFKRDAGEINSEYKKYPQFLDSEKKTKGRKIVRSELREVDFRESFNNVLCDLPSFDKNCCVAREFSKNSHRFVYGKEHNAVVGLFSTAYAGAPVENALPPDPVKLWGASAQSTAIYLRVLAELRQCDIRAGGSGAMGMVIGLTFDGLVIVPANDFLILAINHKLVNEPYVAPASEEPKTDEPESSYSGPDF